MALLREIEGQQEQRENQHQEGVDQARNVLKEAAILPERHRVLEFPWVAQENRMTAEKRGVRVESEGEVHGAESQGQRGLRGGQIQVVDSGDLLIALGNIAVRTLRLDTFAVGIDFHARAAGGTNGKGGALGDGQLNEQC